MIERNGPPRGDNEGEETDTSMPPTGETSESRGHTPPFENPEFFAYHALRAYATLSNQANKLDDLSGPAAAAEVLTELLFDLRYWADARGVDFTRALVLAAWNLGYQSFLDVLPYVDLVLEVAVDIVRDGHERAVGALNKTIYHGTPM
jgi:hypothetical protein